MSGVGGNSDHAADDDNLLRKQVTLPPPPPPFVLCPIKEIDDPWSNEGITQQVSLPSGSCSSNAVKRKGSILLWWWVHAQPHATPIETIKVNTPGSTKAFTSDVYQMHSSNATNAALASNGTDASAQPLTTLAPSPSAPVAMVDVPITLQYVSGCPRTFTRLLSAPIHQPFVVRTSAQEMPPTEQPGMAHAKSAPSRPVTSTLIAQYHLTSLLEYPTTITEASLLPQQGLVLQHSVAQELGLFPLSLPPKGSVSLSFELALDGALETHDRAMVQHRLQQAAKAQPGCLNVSYTLLNADMCGDGYKDNKIAGNDRDDRVQSSFEGGYRPTMQALHAVMATSPGRKGNDIAEEEQHCRFSYGHAFEFSARRNDLLNPPAVIFVQLLGPFACTANQPVSFCWRLERAASPSALCSLAGDKEDNEARLRDVGFEIVGENECWKSLGRKRGVVMLDGYAGALATIEALWMPLKLGTLPVPVLHLQDAVYQEVFDVGSGGVNYIVVS